jgi:hypothetical protein
MLGPFYQGQVPAEPLVMTIYDDTGQPVELHDYTLSQIELILESPLGLVVDTSGGSIQLSATVTGLMQYTWPAQSLFTEVGLYRMQVRLASATAQDLTLTVSFPVTKPLIGALP